MKCAAPEAGPSPAWRIVAAVRLSVPGRCPAVARLTGSLFAGNSAIRFRLDRMPRFSMEAGLTAAVASI